MLRRLFNRLVLGIFIVFAVESATFVLMHAVPGGPFYSEKALPEQVRQNIMEKYGLDQPLYAQYLRYLSMTMRFDFGPSLKYRSRSVRDIIASSFPTSLALGGMALLLAVVIGLPLGTIASLYRGRAAGRAADTAAAYGISLPSFIIAIVLIYVVSYLARLLPPALWESPFHVVLPVLSLAIPTSSVIARLVKEGVVENLGRSFLVAARARGAAGMRFVLHVLRPSMASLLGIFGPIIAMLITGSFVVEQVFAIPGLGRYFVLSVMNRDYPLIMGVTVFYCVVLVAANIVSDIFFSFLDPRSREQAL